MVGKYFYHGTDLKSFVKILETGEIKCRRLIEEQNIEITRTLIDIFESGYNGMEYISLCKLDDSSYTEKSAYKAFIRNSYCLIISSELPAIKTLNIEEPKIKENYSKEILNFIINKDASKLRFSDMPDEWQFKTVIPLKYIRGIGIPMGRLQYHSDTLYNMENVLKLANMSNWDIVNTSDYKFIEKYEEDETQNNVVNNIKKLIYKNY